MLEKLKNAGFKVIEEEGLSKVDEIKFRDSLGGVNRRLGCLIRCTRTEKYRIILNTMKARFFKDPIGKYKDSKTGERFRKATIGEKIPNEDIIKSLAHEIAHLKFWNHNPQHKSYTQHILKKLNEKLSVEKIKVEEIKCQVEKK